MVTYAALHLPTILSASLKNGILTLGMSAENAENAALLAGQFEAAFLGMASYARRQLGKVAPEDYQWSICAFAKLRFHGNRQGKVVSIDQRQRIKVLWDDGASSWNPAGALEPA